MSTAELKLEILSQIIQLDDKNLLLQIKNYLGNSPEDFADELSEEMIAGIEKGFKEIEEGKVVPAEEVIAKLKNRR